MASVGDGSAAPVSSFPGAEPASGLLWIGRGLIAAGSVALLIGSFLPWYSTSAFGISVTETGWHELGQVAWPLAALALLLSLVVLAIRVATVADAVALAFAAAAVTTAWAFVSIRLDDGSYGYGMLVGTFAAAVVAVGAGLGITGYIRSRGVLSLGVLPASFGPAPQAAAAQQAPQAPSVPAAGWYPDPAGSGGHRWWSGTSWTEHVG